MYDIHKAIMYSQNMFIHIPMNADIHSSSFRILKKQSYEQSSHLTLRAKTNILNEDGSVNI